ncbi:PEP-CTERM sorting domain-containing protein [Thalassotalea sp. M1531]|uniref:PEP-CTERM sorting domain-containing protein n=1 Tax=Thalassotalea algicola TaxID=2716224 RepID=A0A7Y0LCL0_9GAMM|nr:PEP-CTERM sorting domain-containing protein [Thalassotalea algicola]NMP31961.1 PEP-CTERM sorting domain-containing protein [Thalassotalea algicola]
MKLLKTLLAFVPIVFAASVSATIITLDFEGIGIGADINDFYNGGTDSLGNSGIDYGISFADAIACLDSDAGGNCNSANEPSPETGMIFLNNDSAILNLSSGFDTGFSFFYSSNSSAATVSVWSEEGATGTLLGSIDFGNNLGNCSGDPNGNYCNWDIGSVAFSGTAKSIDFGGTANFIIYDDVTFGSVDPTSSNSVPTPTTIALFSIALFGLAYRNQKSLNRTGA